LQTRSEIWYETAAVIENSKLSKGIAAFQQPVSHFHLRWAPTSFKINFDRMSNSLFTQMVNHFEGHAEITTKNKLFKNITKFSDEHH
jgi:hypothetical protein